MKKKCWQVARAYRMTDLQEFLAEGWEPFAVTIEQDSHNEYSDMRTIWHLRRKV